MAKMFYTADEAAERLGATEDGLKKLVREGKLREFRDAGKFNYKVDDIESLIKNHKPGNDKPPKAPANEGPPDSSDSGEIILEPVDDSSIELSPSGSDVVSLAESEAGGTAAGGTVSGTTASGRSKGDTVVPSVGVNVFDDDELDEHVDPLAQTAVTDVAGLGFDSAGSGSGIMDLTRESDDTSLGAELLEEIYTGEGGEEKAASDLEMGEDTRAGLDEAPAQEDDAAATAPDFSMAASEATATAKRTTRTAVEYGPDVWSTTLTAAMIVGVVVMLVAGLGAAALVRGITPSLLESIYSKLWLYTAAAAGAAAIAAVATFLVARRRGG